ncbi:hypothetical protein [Lactobacillus taiwanensis]|uniref:hypothetical protein n=1 Tax=Lactobacillus taiwanensis TaxID=508451 RepID=UPI003220667E
MAVTGFLYKKSSYKGMEYWVVQGNFSINGYIKSPTGDKLVKDVWVYGGITYEGYLTELLEGDRVLLTEDPVSETSVFVYGFDTAHSGGKPIASDTYQEHIDRFPAVGLALESVFYGTEWTPELVEDECKNLIDSLLEED